MKKILALFLLFAAVFTLCAEPSYLEFYGTTDQSPISYELGQTVQLKLELLHKGDGAIDPNWIVQWSCKGDDGKPEKTGSVPAGKFPITLEASLDKPGFIWFTARLLDADGKPVCNIENKREYPVEYTGGAGAAVNQIPMAPEPADFDAFWAKMKARLAAVPLEVLEKKLVKTDDKANIYAVKIACAGPRPVTGYLTVPLNAKEKSLPVDLEFFGYSIRKIPVPKKTYSDRIVFWVSAHGIELDQPWAYYNKFFEDLKSNGHTQGLDPEDNRKLGDSFLSHMALRVMRAVEYAKTLPEWNGRTLEANGGSQGGLQSVWAAALDKDVSRINVCIIWCCDIGGATRYGRLCAPIAKGPSQLKPWRMAYVPELDYFDAVNHAKRIPPSCYVNVYTAGLGDYISPPSGLILFFRNLQTHGRLYFLQNAGHISRTYIRKSKGVELKK